MTNGDTGEKPEAAATPETVESEAAPTPADTAVPPESARPVEPCTAPPPAAEPAAPEAPPPALVAAPPAPAEEPATAPEPFDETADLIRVGQVGSGRRLSPLDEDTLRAIRDFASSRPLPGLGTLLDTARSYATSGRGPGLGVDVFSEVRGQLGRLVAELDAIAIHAGPVLFIKTSAKNQPGTALRWLNEEERCALREHPELLDHPGKLAASLKKILAGEPESTDED